MISSSINYRGAPSVKERKRRVAAAGGEPSRSPSSRRELLRARRSLLVPSLVSSVAARAVLRLGPTVCLPPLPLRPAELSGLLRRLANTGAPRLCWLPTKPRIRKTREGANEEELCSRPSGQCTSFPSFERSACRPALASC
jgi:hypothetical protein